MNIKTPTIVNGADRNGYHVYTFNGKFTLWTLRGEPGANDGQKFTADSVEKAYKEKS